MSSLPKRLIHLCISGPFRILSRGWNDRPTHAFDRREVLTKKIESIFNPSTEPSGPVVLQASLRSEMGKHVQRLRDAQRVPCLIFGHGQPEIMCSVELRKIISLRNRGGFTLNEYHLSLPEFDSPFHVKVKQLKLHPVSDVPDHIAFMRVNPPGPEEPKLKEKSESL